MKKETEEARERAAVYYVVVCVGFIFLFIFGYYTSWKAAFSLFIVLWADNYSRDNYMDIRIKNVRSEE